MNAVVADLFVVVVLGVVLSFLFAAVRAFFRWRGFWRWLVLIPLVVMALVVARILIERGHTLWPFELLIWGIGCGLAFLGLRWVRRIYDAGSSP